MGYVDIKPQPHYPFEFMQDDALEVLSALEGRFGESLGSLGVFDAIHASPPCQHDTTMSNRFPEAAAQHPDLIAPTKELLRETGLPFVVENVGGARRKLSHPIRLCGRALGIGVGRHRYFECDGFHSLATDCRCDGSEVGIYGKLDGRRLWSRADGTELRAPHTLAQARALMGIDWMEWDEIREAIPPAMTEHIGGYLMVEINARAAA
jgi:DNA (cytosine-5)-methyltransferase 1